MFNKSINTSSIFINTLFNVLYLISSVIECKCCVFESERIAALRCRERPLRSTLQFGLALWRRKSGFFAAPALWNECPHPRVPTARTRRTCNRRLVWCAALHGWRTRGGRLDATRLFLCAAARTRAMLRITARSRAAFAARLRTHVARAPFHQRFCGWRRRVPLLQLPRSLSTRHAIVLCSHRTITLVIRMQCANGTCDLD